MDDPTSEPLATERDILRRWRAEGYTADFEILAGGQVRCSVCGTETAAEDFQVDRTAREEGATDPGDEELLVAGTGQACGHRGAFTLAYGAYATADESEVARRLPSI